MIRTLHEGKENRRKAKSGIFFLETKERIDVHVRMFRLC